MKNTLTDLNNYLFEELEKLMDDEITGEELDREIKKADTMVKVSEKIIQTGELAYRTMKHMDEYGYSTTDHRLPTMLELKG